MKTTIKDLIQKYDKNLKQQFEETFHIPFINFRLDGFCEGKSIYTSKDNKMYYYDYYNDSWIY